MLNILSRHFVTSAIILAAAAVPALCSPVPLTNHVQWNAKPSPSSFILRHNAGASPSKTYKVVNVSPPPKRKVEHEYEDPLAMHIAISAGEKSTKITEMFLDIYLNSTGTPATKVRRQEIIYTKPPETDAKIDATVTAVAENGGKVEIKMSPSAMPSLPAHGQWMNSSKLTEDNEVEINLTASASAINGGEVEIKLNPSALVAPVVRRQRTNSTIPTNSGAEITLGASLSATEGGVAKITYDPVFHTCNYCTRRRSYPSRGA